MKDITHISSYELSVLNFKNCYFSGSDIHFTKPHIGYITKGYAKFLYNGNTVYAYEGDLIYIALDTKYRSIWYGSPDIQWYSLNFEFEPKHAFYGYRFQILKNYPCEIFQKLLQTYNNAPLLFLSHLYALFDDIYGKMTGSALSVSYDSVSPAIKYIEENYNKDISAVTLEKLCHMSRSAFFKQFKRATGVTPITYKHNIMIQQAIDLLTSTNASIEEISNLVGFSSANYFRKVFYKLTDKTPKALKNKND